MLAKICSILAQTDFGGAENFGDVENFGDAEKFQRRRNFDAVPKKFGPFFGDRAIHTAAGKCRKREHSLYK